MIRGLIVGGDADLGCARHEGMKDLQCMSFTSKGASEIVVAGWQDTMLVIDVIKGEVVKQVGLRALATPLFLITDTAATTRSLPSITTPS